MRVLPLRHSNQAIKLLHLRKNQTVTNDSSAPAETDSKSLVVYFSWSGNTENVAKSIQSQTDSDIFEIVPATPYSDDYDTVVDLAQEEQRNNARPAISGGIENLEQYDVIYVGFPNWWGDMPMILYTFFDTYDLSGKTVALFCTSGGSGLSNTVNEVKDLEPNATVTDGLHIGSGSSSNPDERGQRMAERYRPCQIGGYCMRKMISLLLSLSFVFSLAACGQSEDPGTSSQQPSASNSLEVTDMQATRKLCFNKGRLVSNGQPRIRGVAQCR